MSSIYAQLTSAAPYAAVSAAAPFAQVGYAAELLPHKLLVNESGIILCNESSVYLVAE